MAQEYARALAKVVVAQIAEGLGFDSVQQSASDALAELLLQYVGELGSLTHGYAELAGRAECNVNDVVCHLPPELQGKEEVLPEHLGQAQYDFGQFFWFAATGIQDHGDRY